ncbi:MAG: hypothetical protein A4S17_14230 [Proteobacteria bacterium HN_bin10]|nr:MAG: hypothetical protein A4S17_14230 [Proteobacteria bacterium HN_bin10]
MKSRQGSSLIRLSLTGLQVSLHNAAMSGTIMIEGLEFSGACGVTTEERARPQPIATVLEFPHPTIGSFG